MWAKLCKGMSWYMFSSPSKAQEKKMDTQKEFKTGAQWYSIIVDIVIIIMESVIRMHLEPFGGLEHVVKCSGQHNAHN